MGDLSDGMLARGGGRGEEGVRGAGVFLSDFEVFSENMEGRMMSACSEWTITQPAMEAGVLFLSGSPESG